MGKDGPMTRPRGDVQPLLKYATLPDAPIYRAIVDVFTEAAAGRLPAEPATRARVLGEVLEVLVMLPDAGTGLARVATRVLGRAHALDAGPVPAAVLRAAGWLAGKPVTALTSEVRRRLWASLGVALDMVSSTVLVLGLTLTGDSPLAVSLAAHAAAGLPMRVTLGQLVHHLERAEPRGPRRVWA